MLFAYVITDVKQFLPTCLVVVYQLPVTLMYGTVVIDARPSIAPHMGSGRASGGMTGNVHLETEMLRPLARSVLRPPQCALPQCMV